MRRKAFLLAVVVGFFACGRDEVQVYDAPKQAPAPAAPGASSIPEGAGDGALPRADLAWTVPDGWESRPGESMRRATFFAPGPSGTRAEVSVISLPGDAGGVLANVNRWRGQIGLGPMDEAALAAGATKFSSAAGSLLMVDFESPGSSAANAPKGRLLGAILSHKGNSWFFKMTGPGPAVSSAKPAFLQLLRGLR